MDLDLELLNESIRKRKESSIGMARGISPENLFFQGKKGGFEGHQLSMSTLHYGLNITENKTRHYGSSSFCYTYTNIRAVLLVNMNFWSILAKISFKRDCVKKC